ncbi:chromate transport protein ChrA [Arcanobacterium hippocoleae]|uniref:Chromate transport protein ChrA n=1 Tax=Arcanobacterium hippocoleae TaxID=149017 RepID=A0ABU1SZH8_9ACTO|nr:chromate transport protein ChrA [Arcanobacterium hippocoleae]
MNKTSASAIVPEMLWASSLIFLASDLTTSKWNEFHNLAMIAILTATAVWSIYRRFQESLSEVFWSLLYMASTIGLITIQNSSWTRFTILIIMVAYIYGRNYREKQRGV